MKRKASNRNMIFIFGIVISLTILGANYTVEAADKPQYGGVFKIWRAAPPSEPLGDLIEMGRRGGITLAIHVLRDFSMLMLRVILFPCWRLLGSWPKTRVTSI